MMGLAEWVDDKLKDNRLLSSYPMGEFLPFKTRAGRYLKLIETGCPYDDDDGDDAYDYTLHIYGEYGDMIDEIGLDTDGLDQGGYSSYAINWDEPIIIPEGMR